MRRHRHKDRRIALELHPLSDRLVVRAVGLQVHVIAVPPLDDVVLRVAALADQAVAFGRVED
jgi:hypothetical protein